MSVSVRLTIWTRLIALGFALGGVAHTLGFVLLVLFGVKWYGPTYPAWRHAMMAMVDASVVWIALRRPSWLVFALVGFLVEQVAVNGFHLEPTLVLVLAALVFAVREKWSATSFGAHHG